MSIRPQPLITVRDVGVSSKWYQQVLGAASGHGGDEYEQIVVDGELILQLHRLDVEDHHGLLADPDRSLGNGVALWFRADDFDAAVARIHGSDVQIQTDVHVNPNANQREIWLRDPDNFLVVLAEPYRG